MKRFIALAAVVFAAGLVGCSSTQNTASPGATGSACCAEMKGCCKAEGWSGDVAPGATSGKGCCAADKATAPGAVSAESGCCKSKSQAAPGAVSAEGCAKSCTKDKAAPGAVSGEGSGCCKSKAKSEAAPGAVGGGCCKSKNNG